MRRFLLVFFFLLSGGVAMASEESDLIKKLQSLSDLTAEVTAHNMPSVLISSPDDKRIDQLASAKSQAFLVRSEGSSPFVVIVNPNRKHGYLWWKKAERTVLSGDRWAKLKNGTDSLRPEEKLFIKGL